MGFWLSFAAVMAILLVATGDVAGRTGGGRAVWRKWLRVHVVVSVSLTPLTLLLLDLNGTSLLLDVSGWVLFGVLFWLEWLSQVDLMYTGMFPVGLTQAVVASAGVLQWSDQTWVYDTGPRYP